MPVASVTGISRRWMSGIAVGVCCTLAAFTVSAQSPAPVVEPRPPVERGAPPLLSPPGSTRETRQPQRPPPAAESRQDTDQPETIPFRPPVMQDGPVGQRAAPGQPESMAAIVSQLQQLQQEVMTLRGIVEAQEHQIGRLEREQRERYLDLDRRLARGGSMSETLPDPAASDAGPGPMSEGSSDERAAYEEAFALTRDRQFEEAIERFQALIERHPEGAFEANSWYWLGELYLALPEPDLERSRQSFVQVLQRWPDHHKTADSLYKLGVVYHQLDDPAEARRYLQRVRSEHSGSQAARLAANYLERL